MGVCCEKCFKDKAIIKYVVSFGTVGNCPWCGIQSVSTITMDKVGMFIRAGLNRAYERLEEGTGAIYHSDHKAYIDENGDKTTGESLCDILIDDWDIFSSNIQEVELLEALMKYSAPSQRSIQEGEKDEYPDIYESAYVLKDALYGVEASDQFWAWEMFKNLTMYYNRFFDVDDNKDGRDKLLKSVSKVFPSMGEELKKGSILYRARKIGFEMTQSTQELDFYKEISPAPAQFATSNRMSPQGISYTYLATHADTCYSECRMCIGDYAIVGAFETKRTLKILNLSSKEYLFIENSIFSKDYEHGLNWVNEFIHLFSMEISKLIDPNDKELEYVPTQVLAEYIRKIGYDGIKFESSVNVGSYNYALFCGPNKEISREFYPWKPMNIGEDLTSFTKWLRLCKVNIIQISSNTFGEKDLYHTDKVYRKDLTVEVEGISEFSCIEDVRERIVKIATILTSEYKELLIDGLPFNIIKYITDLISADDEQEHSLSVSKTFGWLTIIIDRREFLFEDKRGANFLFDQMMYKP